MTTLVVAAHPDDEVLGCGGTIARLADGGDEVHVLILGEGATSRDAARDLNDPRVDALRAQSHRAAEILGAASVEHVGLPDNRFDTVALLDVIKHVEEVVDRRQPSSVYVQHGGDLNVDHQITHQALLTATRPVPGQPVRDVYSFRVGSSSEWAFDRYAPVFRATVFVDISETLERKVAAMEAYADEVRPFPHPRSLDGLRATARYWGTVAGCIAAEPFDVVRIVR